MLEKNRHVKRISSACCTLVTFVASRRSHYCRHCCHRRRRRHRRHCCHGHDCRSHCCCRCHHYHRCCHCCLCCHGHDCRSHCCRRCRHRRHRRHSRRSHSSLDPSRIQDDLIFERAIEKILPRKKFPASVVTHLLFAPAYHAAK